MSEPLSEIERLLLETLLPLAGQGPEAERWHLLQMNAKTAHLGLGHHERGRAFSRLQGRQLLLNEFQIDESDERGRRYALFFLDREATTQALAVELGPFRPAPRRRPSSLSALRGLAARAV